MKKGIAILLCILLLTAAGCRTQTPGETTAPAAETATTVFAADAPLSTEFFTEETDDGIRYSGGGISITMEDGFTLQNSSEGYINYNNSVMDAIFSCTDDYDASVLSTYGFDVAELTEEDYGFILIDSNQMDAELFYDGCDNVCLLSDTTDGEGNTYVVYNVVKKDAGRNVFWLLQFIGQQFVYDAYKDYLPKWAASVSFP